MPTEAQINANRLNAQKSTGPTSPEGKAASRLNALKTGIDAWSQIIPGEDPAELEALAEALHLHFHPTDPNQLALVDALIDTEWLARRFRRIEAQLWHYQVECLDKNLTHAEFIDAAIQHNSPLGHAYQDAIDPFSRLHRRVDANNRMYLRTLKALQDAQAAPAQPPTPEIGFVPQRPDSGNGSKIPCDDIPVSSLRSSPRISPAAPESAPYAAPTRSSISLRPGGEPG